MLPAVLVALLAVVPVQDKNLSREAGGAQLGEPFTPPSGAQRQELAGGKIAYIFYDDKGFVFNIKVHADGRPFEIEQIIMDSPQENAHNLRKSIRDIWGSLLIDSKDEGKYFKDIFQDQFTRWEISYGNLEQFENVVRLWMKDLVGQTQTGGGTSSSGVNLDALFGQYGDAFPNGLGGINLGMKLNPGNVWILIQTEGEKKTYEYKYENGDVFTAITDGQGLVLSAAYTFKTQPLAFRETIKQYMLNKYGNYLQSRTEKGDYLMYLFIGTPSGGMVDSLELSAWKSEVTVKSMKTKAKVAEIPPTEEKPVAETGTYVDNLVMANLFAAPQGGLPKGLGPIKLGDKFEAGEVWKLSKTAGGLSYYQYKEYDNNDYTEVRVDAQGLIRSVQHNFINPKAEIRKKVKDYIKGTFNQFYENYSTVQDGSITYYLQRGTGGAESISMALYEWPDALAVRVFFGEL